jgi:hypothetical protein
MKQKTFKFRLFLGYVLLSLQFILFLNPIFSDEPEEFLYVKTFIVGKSGGISNSQAELLRKDFIEELQKFNKFKLIGPEAEDAIRAEQSKIEAEGGAGMMCRAEECRRRLLKVSSADILAEAKIERVAVDINEVKLELYSRKVVSSEGNEKKEQSVNVYSVKYKVLTNEKDNLRMLELAGTILAKKVSGLPVSKDEEERASGLKALGRDNLDNLARSMILPGWGQHSKEHYEKAFLFYTLTVIGVAKCYTDYNNYNNKYKQLDSTTGGGLTFTSQIGGGLDYFSIYYTTVYYNQEIVEWKKSARIYEQSVAGFGVFYAFNLLDAYFSNRRYFLGKPDELTFDFFLAPPTFYSQNSNYNDKNYEFGKEYSFKLNYRF